MLTIYVIYHRTYENTNVFTTDESKIYEMIRKLEEKYEETDGEWSYMKLVENVEFEACMEP